MRHSDNIIHSWNFKPYDNRTISLPPMSKHSQWAFRLTQKPYHPKLFRQRPLRHSAPCLLWTNRLYHPFPLLSWPNARTRIRLGNERPHHRWGRLAKMAVTRRRWWGGIIKLPKRKIQDAYTLLYMCASWIFAYLPQIDSLPTERRPCDFFLFYLSLLIIIS